MKFSSLVLGTRAVHRVLLPLAGVAEPVPVLVRPLSGTEEGDVLQQARAYAIGKGVKDPKDGDRLYDLGLMVNVLAIACMDVDDAGKPFFDQGAPQVLDNLDADRIALLYEAQQLWQEECSPRKSKMTGDGWITKVIECAEAAEGEDPFAFMRPGLRSSFMRITVQAYLALLPLKSSPTSSSEIAGTTSTAPSPDAAPTPAP